MIRLWYKERIMKKTEIIKCLVRPTGGDISTETMAHSIVAKPDRTLANEDGVGMF